MGPEGCLHSGWAGLSSFTRAAAQLTQPDRFRGGQQGPGRRCRGRQGHAGGELAPKLTSPGRVHHPGPERLAAPIPGDQGSR